jgi:hypothetical protein
MATNLNISENQERVPLTIGSSGVLRSITPDNGSPYYVGARAYVTQTASGATVTVIDKDGTTTAVILNGANGQNGADGQDGADGNGIVSIDLTSTVDNVDTYTITYTDGTTDTFEVTNGVDGQDGQDGADGADGADGFSPIATVSKVGDTATISITDENGTTTATISDGTDGTDGQDGTDGADGFSPSATVSKSGDTATISITDKDGTTTTTITDGEDGRDGTDGTDGVDGVGIVSITKTATVGLVDTYTILYSDGTTSTFDVTNGQNGSGSVADVWVDGSSVLDGDTAKIDLTGKSDVGHTHTKSAITDFPTLSAVATSGSYNDLSNKPTIPTVNNATLTIQKNGTNVQTFTANSSSNKTANITVPTAVSELTNDSGYITGYTETDPVFSASAASGISSSDIDNWDAKQDELVSGVSIRTINGTSVLGSGDIQVAAGGTPTPTADTVAEFDSSACMNSSDMSSADVASFVASLNISAPSTLIDVFYPVGSYYETSDTSFNPNIAWSGTWVLETEGQVHISGSINGTYQVDGAPTDTTDGGEETHTLLESEMPSHLHSAINGQAGFMAYKWNAGVGRGRHATSSSGTLKYVFGSSTQDDLMYAAQCGVTGGGQAHNNMQPYIIVHRWHRTA